MTQREKQAICDLIAVATDKIPHRYNGQCPDCVDGFHNRDKQCPACRAIERVEKIIGKEESK